MFVSVSVYILSITITFRLFTINIIPVMLVYVFNVGAKPLSLHQNQQIHVDCVKWSANDDMCYSGVVEEMFDVKGLVEGSCLLKVTLRFY